MLDVIHTPIEREPEPRTTRHRFAFGGVAFEILADEAVQWQLPADAQSLLGPVQGAQVLANVLCSVSVDHAVSRRSAFDATLRFSYEQGCVRAESGDFRLSLRELGARHFAASARLSTQPSAALELLGVLAASVVELAGGLSLSASAIEWDGRAVLLLGPRTLRSRAIEKLRADARCLTEQRVNLTPGQTGWLVWALSSRPAGSSMPASCAAAERSLPLAAILQLSAAARPAELSATFEPATRAALLASLCEATELGAVPPARAAARRQALEALSACVPAAVVHGGHGALDDALSAQLLGFLAQHAGGALSA